MHPPLLAGAPSRPGSCRAGLVRSSAGVNRNVFGDSDAPVSRPPVGGQFDKLHRRFEGFASRRSTYAHVPDRPNADGQLVDSLESDDRKLGLYDRQSRLRERRDAGQRVWQAISQQHGKEVANRVFRNVFGSRLRGHETDHRVEVSLTDLDRLAEELSLSKSGGRQTAGFSNLLWGLRAGKPAANQALYYDLKNGLRTQAKDDGTYKAYQARQAAGFRVWQSIASEHNKAAADRVFAEVFGPDVHPGNAALTVADLKHLELRLRIIGRSNYLAPDALSDLKKLAELDVDVAHRAMNGHARDIRETLLATAVSAAADKADQLKRAGLLGHGMAHHTALATNIAKLAINADGEF